MKALTLHQPYASLVVLGIKTWETRPAPFSGDMRQAGVRGLPGLRIDRGERIAIHAAAKRPDFATLKRLIADDPDVWNRWCAAGLVDDGAMDRGLPLGAIVGYVTIADTLPIIQDGWRVCDPWQPCVVTDIDGLTLYRTDDPDADEPIDDQLPCGHWLPGNWASLLVDPEPCDPIPAKGKQGVWEWTP
jgi:hypothetical protein